MLGEPILFLQTATCIYVCIYMYLPCRELYSLLTLIPVFFPMAGTMALHHPLALLNSINSDIYNNNYE